MTEYEKLKEEIIATAAIYTGDAKALTTRLMTIIAEKCWLKDEKRKLPNEFYYGVTTLDKVWSGKEKETISPNVKDFLEWAGWRPVIEIKKEEIDGRTE